VDRAGGAQGFADPHLADLKGKKIAATKGTDPYLFLLRSLQTAGCGAPTSNTSACSTPTAASRWNKARSTPGPGSIRTWPPANWSGSRLLYRNVAFNTYGRCRRRARSP
jgi:sulfonate transport system substrate-binding protein